MGDPGLKCPGKTSVSRDCAVMTHVCVSICFHEMEEKHSGVQSWVAVGVLQGTPVPRLPFLNGETEEEKEK